MPVKPVSKDVASQKKAEAGLLNDIASLVKKEVGTAKVAPRNKPPVAAKSDELMGIKRDVA